MLDSCCWKEPDAAGKIDVTLEPPSTTSVLEVVDAFEQVLVAAATAVPGAPEQTFGMPSWWEVSMQRWCNQHGLVYPEGLWAVLKIGESEAKAGWWLPFRLQPEETTWWPVLGTTPLPSFLVGLQQLGHRRVLHPTPLLRLLAQRLPLHPHSPHHPVTPLPLRSRQPPFNAAASSSAHIKTHYPALALNNAVRSTTAPPSPPSPSTSCPTSSPPPSPP